MEQKELAAAVEAVLENDVRPQLKEHGGDVALVAVDDGICRVKLLGQCSGCPSALLTTREVIGEAIMEAVPQIKSVELDSQVSDELMDFAKSLMGRNR